MNDNEIKQLTELRDALKGYRSELTIETLRNAMGFYISDSDLKQMLINDNVVRALWYCLCNSNIRREELIDKLYDYFTINHQEEKASELISVLLFLAGVDFQINPMKDRRQDAQAVIEENDIKSDVHNKNTIKHKLIVIVALGVILCILISFLGIKSYLKDSVSMPEGILIGTVISDKGKTIQLWEYFNDGESVLEALSKKKNGKFVEEEVFKKPDGKLTSIISVKFNKWISSNPKDSFYSFNENDNLLYIPLINNDLTGADRFIVFQFDGQNFVCTTTNAAGYWLHPSLQDFDSLFAVGRTDTRLVRIDYVKKGFRYAAWNSDKTMKDEPDITLYNDGKIENDKIVFKNTSYRYIFDYGTSNLWIYNGKRALSGSHNMEIISK